MSTTSSKPVADPGEHQSSNRIELVTARQGQVDLETDISQLGAYLERHQDWIQRCFKPLKVDSMSADTYKLQFFRIGGLGFELEPCFGVRIWQEDHSVFRLGSLELPSDAGLPYHVDCQASFSLTQPPLPAAGSLGHSPQLPVGGLTRVNWTLNLGIQLELPGFLQVLPRSLVLKMGSKVVNQVTRSMSDRLTHNVCSDFYRTVGKAGRKYHISNTLMTTETDPDEKDEKEVPLDPNK